MNRKKQHRQPSSPEPLLGQLIVLDLPARAGEGEDSLSFDFRRDVGFMAVCDGCGGLGARRYPAFGQHTGAYVAARVAAQTVFDRFGELAAAQPSALTQPQALARALEDALRFRLEELQAQAGRSALRIGGTMVRSFPTTLCALVQAYAAPPGGAALVWAGDSRAYRLTPSGLQQLTRDDLSGQPDAFDNLYKDAHLTNIVNADAPFTLHARALPVMEPQVLLTATDGFFGYFPSPMDFELFLLETMARAEDYAAWRQAMAEEIAAVTGDDVAAVMTVWRYPSFPAMREAFAPRLHRLRTLLAPSRLPDGTADGNVLRGLWQDYRRQYECWEDEDDGAASRIQADR